MTIRPENGTSYDATAALNRSSGGRNQEKATSMKPARPATEKRVRPSSPLPADGLLESAQASCLNLETLAGLLTATGHRNVEELMEVRLVANVGSLLGEETQRLRRVLTRLHRRLANDDAGS
jgi:hypothetical protein